MSPCIVFIDEIDGILSHRRDTDSTSVKLIKMTLLTCLSGLHGTKVKAIGTTNRPASIDSGFMRRLDVRVYVRLPDDKARNGLLRSTLKGYVGDEHDVPSDKFNDVAVSHCKGLSCDEIVRAMASLYNSKIIEAMRFRAFQIGMFELCKPQEQGAFKASRTTLGNDKVKPGRITLNDLINQYQRLVPECKREHLAEFDAFNIACLWDRIQETQRSHFAKLLNYMSKTSGMRE
ncbi:MAG: hypothetical protein Q9209_003650 [Squamulea sp. 1 TL-2023]